MPDAHGVPELVLHRSRPDLLRAARTARLIVGERHLAAFPADRRPTAALRGVTRPVHGEPARLVEARVGAEFDAGHTEAAMRVFRDDIGRNRGDLLQHLRKDRLSGVVNRADIDPRRARPAPDWL